MLCKTDILDFVKLTFWIGKTDIMDYLVKLTFWIGKTDIMDLVKLTFWIL